MKKLVFILIFLICFPLMSLANEQWSRIAENIFVNYESIKKEINGQIGWFKIIEPQQRLYRLEKYKAYCSSGVIEVQHIQFFNDSHELVSEKVTNNAIGCDYTGIVNGELYYRILCKKRKFLFNPFLKINFFH